MIIESVERQFGYVPLPQNVLAPVVDGAKVVGILRGAGAALHMRKETGEEEIISPLRLSSPREVRAMLSIR